jgi:methylthioribose-1-phosphate isomerase
MALPLLTRRGDTLRYDRERGIVLVLDRRAYPHETVFVECADVEAVARAVETMVVQGGPPLAYVAGYGLALAARAWKNRPSEARRGAIIQAAERLRRQTTCIISSPRASPAPTPRSLRGRTPRRHWSIS